MSQDWTEKYRPKKLGEIIGNPKATGMMKDWATAWNDGKQSKKALVLMGSPGIGKTSAAAALASEMGWELVEMNASDQRTGDAIRAVALRGAYLNTFGSDGRYMNAGNGQRKLIVLDEADSLFGREDRGALPAIAELIRETKQPVILIVNDFYALSRKSSVIKSDTMQVQFMRPRTSEIVKALRRIASEENIAADDKALETLAGNANGDMRAAVRNLESLALGRSRITAEDASGLSDRIVKKDMYDLMDAVFRKNDGKEARRLMMDVDESPDHVELWIDENLPHEYRDPGDLVRGYEKLSKADVFLGRVHRRQYYGFWSYAGDLMTSGIAAAKMGRSGGGGRFRFPSYLMKMSRSKGVRALKAGICGKLAMMMHTTTFRISNDVLPQLKVILGNDGEMRSWLVAEAGLEADEIGFLLNEKIDSKIVKDAMLGPVPAVPDTREEKMKDREETGQKAELQETEERPRQEERTKEARGQKNLFEF